MAPESAPTTNGHHAARLHFTVKDETVENLRPMKVVCIGAGFSGIYAAIRIPERLRNVELTVYEKNEKVGGVWQVNKYPGVACDIVSHSYQYSFAPNPYWSDIYAPGAEIQKYMEGVADKYGAMRFIKTRHEVQSCVWDNGVKKWKIKVKNLETGEVIDDSANVVISARGLLSEISWPKIEGLKEFKGKLMHSGQWDESYDFRNKKIGIIGNGSSAIQIVPKLQALEGTHLTCFGRSPTWIVGPFGDMPMEKWGLDPSETKLPKDLQSKFATNPDSYLHFRKHLENEGNAVHAATLLNNPMQLAGQEFFTTVMKSKLSSRPDLSDFMIPKFAPGCRRLTPGPGYLEALCEPNVTFLTSPITRITETGVTLTDGKAVEELDVLICATGFQTSNAPPFPVIGRNEMALATRWQDRPETYLSVTTNGFPNLFLLFGPNSAIGSGSLTLILEAAGDYAISCIRKLQREDYASMEVLAARVADFQEYCGEYFKGTVYGDDCESWYKVRCGRDGGKWVSGLWPGSTLHAVEALRAPRWEDYWYEALGEEDGEEEGKGKGKKNRMAWLGNGWTTAQLEGDTSWYVNPGFVDTPLEGKPEEREDYNQRPWCF